MVYLVAIIVCGHHGLAVIIYPVAVMNMFCSRHCLWLSACVVKEIFHWTKCKFSTTNQDFLTKISGLKEERSFTLEN